MNISKLQNILPLDIYTELKDILAQRTLTRFQLIHILATCEHECGWKNYQEGLNYSPKRLLEVFPKRVKTYDNAVKICKGGPVAIANFLYNGRMGNRLGSNDGFNFSGKGCIQITGRENYSNFDATVPENIIEHPDLLLTKYKLRSAFWFFDKNGLFSLCKDLSKSTTTTIRKRVNGGVIGLEDVINIVDKYNKLIN